MRVIYLAHRLSADTREGVEANRRNAAKWAAWVSTTFGVAVSADWIWLTGELEETPENRAWGLECDKALIERCDELWMVGPSVSSGMTIEVQHARARWVPVYDLTGVLMERDFIDRALSDQGRCHGCGRHRILCERTRNAVRELCCPDCTHGVRP